MNEIIVIRTGYKFRGENWNSFVNGYFTDVVSAEKFLEANGYEHDYDDVYSSINEDGMTILARIEGLNLIEVK